MYDPLDEYEKLAKGKDGASSGTQPRQPQTFSQMQQQGYARPAPPSAQPAQAQAQPTGGGAGFGGAAAPPPAAAAPPAAMAQAAPVYNAQQANATQGGFGGYNAATDPANLAAKAFQNYGSINWAQVSPDSLNALRGGGADAIIQKLATGQQLTPSEAAMYSISSGQSSPYREDAQAGFYWSPNDAYTLGIGLNGQAFDPSADYFDRMVAAGGMSPEQAMFWRSKQPTEGNPNPDISGAKEALAGMGPGGTYSPNLPSMPGYDPSKPTVFPTTGGVGGSSTSQLSAPNNPDDMNGTTVLDQAVRFNGPPIEESFGLPTNYGQPTTGSGGSGNPSPFDTGGGNTDLDAIIKQWLLGGQTKPDVFTPRSMDTIDTNTQNLLNQQLTNPNPWTSDLVKSTYDRLNAGLTEQYDVQRQFLGEEMARRGLGSSTIYGGRLGDLGIQQARAQADLVNQLLGHQADAQTAGVNSALGNAMGYSGQQYGQDVTTFNTNQSAQNQNFQQNAQRLAQALGYDQQRFEQSYQTYMANHQQDQSLIDFWKWLVGGGEG